MKTIIMAAIGVAVLMTATVGFGATLATGTTLANIGGDDNVSVPAARANVSALTWTERVSPVGVVEVGTITFTVTNEDAADPHVFDVCAILEGPVGTYAPLAGNAPECITTASIAASGTQTGVTLSFGTSVDVSDLVDISISIEETT